MADKGFPKLTDDQIKSFAKGIELQCRCGLGYRRSLQYDHEVSRHEGHLAKAPGRLARLEPQWTVRRL
ncbi:hypothetical protein G6F31_021799 [Rhizopus arrhizus]|nr:hypothetical protein G6F31_021799 [Rhizopus arrhizus]